MRNRFFPAVTFACLLAMGNSALVAQTPTGDEDPTAKTGALKSQIETAGSYNAHSGNMTRVVPDMKMPGALGVYGLNFTRYYNSLRSDRIQNLYLNPAPEPNQPTDFGAPGWSHSWRWSADYDEYLQEVGGDGGDEVYHMMITITFPDGRATKYKMIRTKNWPYGQPWPPDPRFGPPFLAAHGENNWVGGQHDHLRDMAEDGTNFWLYREDGGSVHFTGGPGGWLATEVFDPNGFKTLLHYDANWQLYKVEQEAGGRHLNIIWENGKIKRVQSGGTTGIQTVEYNYPSGLLASVTYQNDPAPGQTTTAQYTYVTLPPPVGFMSAGPLLATAIDPRFEGAMTNIAYTYQGTGCRPQGQPMPPSYPNGQFDYYYSSPSAIKEERYLNPVNGVPGEIVSSFGIGCFDGTRTEYTALGGFRKFFFGRSAAGPGPYSIQGYQLAKLTDYTTVYPLPGNLPFEKQNWLNGHPRQIWNGRGIMTEAVHADGSGKPSEIRHVGSDGSIYKYDRINPGNSLPRDTTRIRNPLNRWLFSKTDENNQQTTYTRDERRRVTRIDYPGGSSEHFTYNVWNQVVTHTLPSGAVKTYEYDGRGLLTREYNSVDRVLDGTIGDVTYTYDELDRVRTRRDARAAVSGKDFSTRMTYNGRHKALTVEYAGMNTAPKNTKVSYGYDAYGNCTSITNEAGHVSLYEYDYYRRCTAYIEPLNAPDWSGAGNVPSRRWDWLYDRWIDGVGYRSAYSHTSNVWRIQIEPVFNDACERRMTARNFDLENRITYEQAGWIQPCGPIGNWYQSADLETHNTTYDADGNKSTFTDPRGRVTSYVYDNRSRLWKTIEPLNRVTENLYDLAGNKTLVRFPDMQAQQWLDYDGFGQAWRFIDERNNTTHLTYQWGPMKKLDTVTTHRERDNGTIEDQTTNFEYDGLGRLNFTYFPDNSFELSAYRYGQVDAFRNRKTQTKRFTYDARGRETFHSWDGNAAPSITRTWSAASLLLTISNSFSYVDFRYDDAGQVWWEGNNITGSGGRRQTTYYRYPDGNIAQMQYPNGTSIRHDYTARGQLKRVWDNWSGWQQPINYTYLPDGKVHYQDYGNGVRTTFDYDGRGFARVVHSQRLSPIGNLSHRTYYRDDRDRIYASLKSTDSGMNARENGRGDRFWYDPEGQLTDAYYEALDPAGNPQGPMRQEHFVYDKLGNRKDSNYLATKGWLDFDRKDNKLNQYRAWWPYSIINYDEDIAGFGTPGEANGVIMQDGWITGSYNALNQPVLIWSASNPGGAYTWFGFDPLGRCVKRWLAQGDGSWANSPTYFYYNGWNLIQEGASATSVSRLYIHGGRVDEIVKQITPPNGGVRYFQHDARGHCILQTDGSGNLMEQYDYDAFGQPYFYNAAGTDIGNSPWGNRFLFTGREWLSNLKLYDYRNRLYQPELGRFLQPDPKQFEAGDYNLYRYCHNDPINKSDPFGLDTLIIWNTWADGSRNWWGHVALATTGQGVQSVGNGDNAGKNYSHASTTSYLASQANIRNTLLFTVRTTPEQEQKINAYLDARANIRSDEYADNCAVRTSEALRAAGLNIQKTHYPQSVFEQSKRVLGGTQSTINKGENAKAQQYSSFNPTNSSESGRLVTPIGSHIPRKVDEE